MKYHINFGNENRISFEVLDTPIAQKWATMLKDSIASDDVTQKIEQHAFPSVRRKAYYNNLTSYYNQFKEMNLVTNLFSYKPINELRLDDFKQLDRDVELLYLKAVVHDNFYSHTERDKIRHLATRMRQSKEGLMDVLFNPEESYVEVKVNSSAELSASITDSNRETYWVENARPAAVIRIHPDEDIMSLNKTELRKNLIYYSKNKQTITYSSPKHRICFYDTALNDKGAENFMQQRRTKMLDFVVKNKLDIVPGETKNYNFVEPVVAHLISDQQTMQEYFDYVGNSPSKSVTITIEE